MPLKYQKNFFGSEVWRMDIFYSYVNTFSFVLFFDNFVSYFWQENSSLLISLEQLDLVWIDFLYLQKGFSYSCNKQLTNLDCLFVITGNFPTEALL